MAVHKIKSFIRHNQGFFQGAGGLELHYQSWHPASPPKAVVVGVHGHGDHSGGLGNIAQHLVIQGYIWYGLDLRGHGRSPGRQGHVQTWKDYQEDLKAFILWIRNQEADPPLFLLGHSLGGLICLEYALQYPSELQGVIAVSPALSYSGLSPVCLKIIRILSLVRPEYTIELRPDYTKLTRDTEAAEILAADPLRHAKMTLRLGRELLNSGNQVRARAHDLKVPLLMLYGLSDPITPAEGSRRFFGPVVLADKERHEYPQSLHRPFDDVNRAEVLGHLSAWLNRQADATFLPEKVRFIRSSTSAEAISTKSKASI
ncbi:MAG TPA: lysophospholipase [Syntrophomonadaceae bacterium]|nr:lysophospholipase [Syntrophomonadaceae bacterium]